MSYVFDTSSIRSLQHFYPRVFKSVWDGLDELVVQKKLISTREVINELERQAVSDEVLEWVKNHKAMFSTPTGAELLFVAEIFKIRHFQGLIGAKQRLKGTPVADPFVSGYGGDRRRMATRSQVACAKAERRQDTERLRSLQNPLHRPGRIHASARMGVLMAGRHSLRPAQVGRHVPSELHHGMYQHAVLKHLFQRAMTNTSLRKRFKPAESQRSPFPRFPWRPADQAQ